VEEDDGFPLSVATFGVVERYVRREGDRSEVHVTRLLDHPPPSQTAFPKGSYTHHEHDATWQIPVHLAEGYSRECVEVDFSVVHIQDAAYNAPSKPQGSLPSSSTPGDTLGEEPLHLVVLDRYAGS
jgi:hypothetical protein